VTQPKIASRDEWLSARKELLAKEKDFNRARDVLSAERRKLPMVAVDKEYVFEGPKGRATLRDLFGPHPQLIVYHFMLDPTWEAGCKSCSLIADNIEGGFVHFAARNTAFAMISRAALPTIEAFKKRMGWSFPWLSSAKSDFNYDFHVTLDSAKGSTEYNYIESKDPAGEVPGCSVFMRDGERVFHTYSTFSRGLDMLIGTYNYLDLTPLGRDESSLKYGMEWVRHHDKY
jgi:predicted dithiol-disulfide oxidoreductase (DUF899 family)